jgi:hypothetical protein
MTVTDGVLGKSVVDIPITDVLTTIFSSENISEYKGVILWIRNNGNTTISVANIEVSPDNEDWYTLDTTTFKLAASIGALLKLEGYPFFRLQANCATGLSTVIDIGFTVMGSLGI